MLLYQALKWPKVDECACMNSALLSYNNRNGCMRWLYLCVGSHFHRCNHSSFLHRQEEGILQYSIQTYENDIPNLNFCCGVTACISLPVYYGTGARDVYSQPARQSVVQTKWFGLAGSRGADNGSTVQLKCLWCQWLCQQPRVADPKWRRAECPAGACHGLNRPVLIHFFWEGGAFLPGLIAELGGLKQCSG